MKNLKSVLALVMALCLMLCLAVPAFATETETTVATEATTEAATEATTTESDEAATEPSDDIVDGDQIEIEGDILTTGEESAPVVKTIRIVLLVLEVLASLALILVVLFQSGKEAGLSGALSGSNDNYLSRSKKASLDKKLASATKWIALAWIILTLALAILILL